MYQDVPSLDQRLSDLHAELDRLSASLQVWREQQDHLRPTEDRLAELTRQFSEVVSHWGATEERQARAVGQLESRVAAFSSAEDRLHLDAAERIGALERRIEQEWSALKHLHETPVRELREQAQALSQVSVAATVSGIGGLERADARLAQIEASMNARLAGMSDQLSTVVAELRALSSARTADAASWPIEGVVRLHNQLREAEAAPSPAPVPAVVATEAAAPGVPAQIATRLDTMERTMAERDESLRIASEQDARATRLLKAAAGAMALLVVLTIGVGWSLRREAQRAAVRAAAADQQAQATAAAADEQIRVAREEAARQVAEARAGSARAQAVGDVLAAPDLIRYSVTGAGPNGVSGQVLWSRSRGVVFSAVRLPPPPASMTYQLWLLTDALPVTAGTFDPDTTGRVTFTADAPRVPRAVVGAAITVEPAGGSEAPSERLLVQNRTVRAPVLAP